MTGIAILEAIIIAVLILFFIDVRVRIQHPEFIFEIDDSNPEDVKFTMSSNKAPEDLRPGRIYILKAIRKK